jgi:hypothetical protein
LEDDQGPGRDVRRFLAVAEALPLTIGTLAL